MKIKVEEGNIFLVPLRDGSGYGIGVIARKYRSLLLGYFWKKKFLSIPKKNDLNFLKKEDAFWKRQFVEKGLTLGEWEIIGSIPNFKKEDWEMPKFIHKNSFDEFFCRIYDDRFDMIQQFKLDDLSNLSEYSEDGLAGYGSVELSLTDYLR